MSEWRIVETDSHSDLLWAAKDGLYLTIWESCAGGYSFMYHRTGETELIVRYDNTDLAPLLREAYRIMQVV